MVTKLIIVTIILLIITTNLVIILIMRRELKDEQSMTNFFRTEMTKAQNKLVLYELESNKLKEQIDELTNLYMNDSNDDGQSGDI